ncbi:MAG: V-type ATP synthase subunit F [Nitrospinota bacterium]
MSEAVFIGDPLSGMAFRPLGVEVREAEDAQAAAEQVHRAVEKGCAVLLVTEECALWASGGLEALRAKPLPAVCILPGVSSPGGLGLARLKENVEKALGSSLILQDEGAHEEGGD